MAALFLTTRNLLDAIWASDDWPDEASSVIATQALPHVEDIEDGFRVWLRTGTVELAELRALVARAGVRCNGGADAAERRAELIETMHDLALTAASRPNWCPHQCAPLAALEHARLVFALLPKTPAEDVHYPAGRRTYADISAPRRPAELAERIEELERNLWSVATRSPAAPDRRRLSPHVRLLRYGCAHQRQQVPAGLIIIRS